MQNTTIRTMVDSSALEAAITELCEIRELFPEVPERTYEEILDELVEGLTYTSKPHFCIGHLQLLATIVIPDSHDERMAALRWTIARKGTLGPVGGSVAQPHVES